MYLVKFLLLGAVIAGLFGELGHFPFGSSSGAIYLADVLILLTLIFSSIWLVSTGAKVYLPKAFKWIALFWLVGILSLAFSLWSFSPAEVAKGSLYLIRFALYSMTFLIAFNLKRSGILTVESLVFVMTRTGLAVAILGFIQLIVLPNFNSSLIFLTDFGFDPHQGRLASTFLDPNFVGTYLVLTLGLIVYRLKKYGGRFEWFVAGVVALAVILTLSRSAYLMAGVLILGIVITFGKNWNFKQKTAAALTAVILAGSLFLFYPRVYERLWGGLAIDVSAAQRFESWEKGWTIFQRSPLIGVGFNNLRTVSDKWNLVKAYSSDGGHAGAGIDSSLLQVLATTGVVGFVVYLGFWVRIWRSLRKKNDVLKKNLLFLLIGLFLDSQFINALFFPPIMLMVFSLLGTITED